MQRVWYARVLLTEDLSSSAGAIFCPCYLCTPPEKGWTRFLLLDRFRRVSMATDQLNWMMRTICSLRWFQNLRKCQDGFTSLIEDFQVNSLVSLRMIHPCHDSFRKINLKPAFVKWLYFYNWNRVVMISENDPLVTNCNSKLKLAFNGWD